MTLESFMNIYTDMLNEKEKIKNANNKETGNKKSCFLHCRFSNNALTKIKVNIDNIAFIEDVNGNATNIIRIIPETDISSLREFATGCYSYIDMNDILCVSDAERAPGYTAEDIIRTISNNKRLIEKCSRAVPLTEKQTDLLMGTHTNGLQDMYRASVTIGNQTDTPSLSSAHSVHTVINSSFEPVSSVITSENTTETAEKTDTDVYTDEPEESYEYDDEEADDMTPDYTEFDENSIPDDIPDNPNDN